MKRCIAGIAVLLAVGVFATDMEQKARTILTCRTSNAGVAEITCDDPGEWGFDGVKLDFIDSFKVDGEDPAVAENCQGGTTGKCLLPSIVLCGMC